jgi:hypothetical protein
VKTEDNWKMLFISFSFWLTEIEYVFLLLLKYIFFTRFLSFYSLYYKSGSWILQWRYTVFIKLLKYKCEQIITAALTDFTLLKF